VAESLWSDYLADFHQQRAGITEEVLAASVDDRGIDPYRWLADAVTATDGVVVDVGCGTGPMAPRLTPGARWVGVDPAGGELAAAQGRRRAPVVQATAEALPVATGAAAGAVAAMALMVVADPVAALVEVRRVLVPGGRLAVLVPAARLLSGGDTIRWLGVMAALGRRSLPFPHPEVIDDPTAVLRAAGAVVRHDESRSFAYPLADRSSAARLVASLYLPRVSLRRQAHARWVLSRLEGGHIGMPLRRIVAEFPDRPRR